MATAKKTLVIVESPSKAKTIGKFLGSRYKVIASVGHVRDLPKSKLGIVLPEDLTGDIDEKLVGKEAFDPMYINIRGKGDLIKELKKEAKNASKVYLATDPDREGEAISWHLAYLLGIDANTPCRVVFNEITSKTVKEAVKKPRPIDLSLVDAQQARRVLDRLVGYQISPLLWRKIQRGLSAGRVQSAALKIICDRENEIKAFVPEEYWTITALFRKNKEFEAKLSEAGGKKLAIRTKAENDAVLSELKGGNYVVSNLEEKDRLRKPAPPFTTSSLQQDAANKLNFTTKKTMMVAQQLYEGVEIKGMGTIGLVSYIRTDSVRLSDEARAAAKDYIINSYGSAFYGGTVYSNKKKDVQDAHEAIRPSNVALNPEDIKDQLTKDQYNLYRLIWQRFIASQMSPAKLIAVNAKIENGKYAFKASGSKVTFEGFLRVMPSKDALTDKLLPELTEGEVLNPESVKDEQSFTQPPARFTEATLVKDLEDKDIGRPSTYAPIVATLSERRYIKKEKKYLVPTELGFTVTDMMTEYFKEIVDISFTANMEESLDDIEAKGIPWKNIIKDYYSILKSELDHADEVIEKLEPEVVLTGETCEICGKPMAIKRGRYGDFIACTGYPECKNTKPIVTTVQDVKCPKCGGDILVKKSRRGKLFYGCSGYPACDQAFWDKPVNKKCPKCGNLLVEKNLKNSKYSCSNKDCDYKE